MTLLEANKNREVGRKPFIEKLKIYETSDYKLSKYHINFNDWNAANITSRQRDMANKAASVWKINY